jgi:hypothetical protein
MAMAELDLRTLGHDKELIADALYDAIDAASDQDTITWLTDGGKRVAAIVPVDVAEREEATIAAVLATPLRGGGTHGEPR